MSNAIRLVNGGAIQVRTGVLQGIGPQGPKGPSGSQGADGPQGLQGDTGPMGQILQQMSRTLVGTNTLAANTDTVIALDNTGAIDQLNCFKSTTNIGFDNAGDYLLSIWMRFDAAAVGNRQVWFQTVAGSALIARTSRTSAASGATYVDLTFPYRSLGGGELINILARSDAATGVSLGIMCLNRIGSGPMGLQGPQGIQGATGATGATGAQGPAGTANSGFAKYSDLLPH